MQCEIKTCYVRELLGNQVDADVILMSPLICQEQLMIEQLFHCPVNIVGIGAYALFDVKDILFRIFETMENYVA